MLQHLGQGDVSLRKPIRRFDGRHVVFEDGRSDEVDLVLLATGYRIVFPFLADTAALNLQPRTGAPHLYLNIFPPGDNGLFVAGLLEGAGVGWAGRALQTDLIAAWLKARRDRPQAAAAFRRRIAEHCAASPAKGAATTASSSIS